VCVWCGVVCVCVCGVCVCVVCVCVFCCCCCCCCCRRCNLRTVTMIWCLTVLQVTLFHSLNNLPCRILDIIECVMPSVMSRKEQKVIIPAVVARRRTGAVQTSDEQSGNRLLRQRLSHGPIERHAGNTTKTHELLLTQCMILIKM